MQEVPVMGKLFVGYALVAVVVFAVASPDVSAKEPAYYEVVDQSEFATAVYAAILNVVRSSVDPAHALWTLQDKELVDPAWDGRGQVTVGEAVKVFDRMGIQLSLDADDETLLTSAMLENVLRTHRGDFRRNKQHWDIVTKFSRGLTLGSYRERVVSGSGF
jgi:hypothetical protein